MTAAVKQHPTAVSNEDTPRKPSELFSTRRSQELVFAFSGPIGCGTKTVIDQTTEILQNAGYEVFPIKLSKFIDEAIEKGLAKAKEHCGEVTPETRYYRLQDGGNDLRTHFGGDILAEYAIKQIAEIRTEKARGQASDSDNVKIKDYVPKRFAYLIDQLKHPDEVALLRTVYRNLFHLIGVISVDEHRRHRLVTSESIPEKSVSSLMERDRKEEESSGQQLEKTLQLADFFVRNDRPNIKVLQNQIERFVRLIHGHNGISPTRHEYGMYIAYAAGLRSACLSRQVGAAILDTEGRVLATGRNDVPRFGGGLYSGEEGAEDARCVFKEEQTCFNEAYKRRLRDQIRGVLAEEFPGRKATSLLPQDAVGDAAAMVADRVYAETGIRDLIEYSRSIHAEMDAIISVARSGGGVLADSSLYTTTFPCHSCARHIVAAGIKRVFYIEPYEKSLAKKLHSDSIEFEPDDDVANEQEKASTVSREQTKTRFVHFEGVAPRQYLNLFRMHAERKTREGKVIQVHPVTSEKSITEYLDDYRDFEAKVVKHLKHVLRGDDDNSQ